MTLCRTLDEVIAAARQDALADPPLTQEGADQAAAILAPWYAQLARERAPAA